MGIRSGNATLLAQGVCRNTANLILYYDAPAASFADLRDAIADEYNYQDELVLISGQRQYVPLANGQPSGILSAAGAADGDQGTVGQPVPNPQGRAEFADAVIEKELRDRVIQWKLTPAPAPDPNTIPTPDVGG